MASDERLIGPRWRSGASETERLLRYAFALGLEGYSGYCAVHFRYAFEGSATLNARFALTAKAERKLDQFNQTDQPDNFSRKLERQWMYSQRHFCPQQSFAGSQGHTMNGIGAFALPDSIRRFN
jgi:hypothetical protein